jgi:hypothetical protein
MVPGFWERSVYNLAYAELIEDSSYYPKMIDSVG